MATHVTSLEVEAPQSEYADIVPVLVWQWPVRLVHWLLVLSLTCLTITGFYMHGPFIELHSARGWVMGTARFIHEISGFVLIAALIIRFYWFLVGNRWENWRAFVPLTKQQWVGAYSMVTYYIFRRREPVAQVGHNALAAMTYIGIYSLLFLEVVTGLVLYSKVVGSRTLNFFVGWISRMIDIQYIRTIHFLIMFVFMAFMIQHIYSAVLVATAEKNGEMESIFSGWKFVSRKLLQKEIAADKKSRTMNGK
jgi:Ni/Fe-hydrogenase 1 B-type cytochrome subunit